VFFAQSTQSRSDKQDFPDGAAFEVPAHSRVVGQVHLLNTTGKTIRTKLHFSVTTLAPDEVTVPLRSMAFSNLALDLAPASITHARMDCGVPQPDFDIYYVLPHYHSLGTTMRIALLGGPGDGDEVFATEASYGEALGKSYSPPVAVRGVKQLRITCEFDNVTEKRVRYGNGDQEMCVALLYASIDHQGGGLAPKNSSSQDIDGVHVTDAPCLSASLTTGP
jgi:hypothetical protein